MPLPYLVALTLLAVYGFVLVRYLWRAHQVRAARRRRLEARIAELGRNVIAFTRDVAPWSGTRGQAARAGADGPTPALPLGKE